MVSRRKCMFQNSSFLANILLMGPLFFKIIGGHGHRLRVGIGPVPKYFFVSELRQFSYIRAKKSYPTPLCGSVCQKQACAYSIQALRAQAHAGLDNNHLQGCGWRPWVAGRVQLTGSGQIDVCDNFFRQQNIDNTLVVWQSRWSPRKETWDMGR